MMSSTGGSRTVSGARPAGWGIRVLAFLIDIALPVLVIAGAWALTAFSSHEVTRTSADGTSFTVDEPTALSWVFWLAAFIAIGISAWNQGYRQSLSGYSFGKQRLGIRQVTVETDEPLGVNRGMLHWLFIWVDFLICYIGVLWPLWDAHNQTLIADKLSRAHVIHEKY